MTNLKVDQSRLNAKLRGMGVRDPLRSNVLGEVYIMLSLECNLRCKVCSWWGIKGPCRDSTFFGAYASSLGRKELLRFARDVVSLRPKTVTFSGGEPLLNKNWYFLASYFHRHKVKVSLTTNGVFISRNLHRITAVVDEINLSLGGPPSILHLIRENPVSHLKEIIKGLKMVTAFKAKYANRPNLRILYTISDLSYSHMEELIKFVNSAGIKVDHYFFQHLMFINKETLDKQGEVLQGSFGVKHLNLWKGYTWRPSGFNFSRFREEIKKLKRMDNVSFSPDLELSEIEGYYKYNLAAGGYARYCTAPWHQVNMMPNGDIYICHDYFIGNIKNESFIRVWNGEKAQGLRRYLWSRLFPACKGCFYHYCDRKD